MTEMPQSPKRVSEEQSSSPANKKQKASPEEKAARLAEKVARRVEREEKKKLKDEARAKEMERKRLKDEVKAKELAEKEKKERSQLKMGNFFKRAAPVKQPPILAKEESSIFKPFYLKEHTRLASRPCIPTTEEIQYDNDLAAWRDEAPPDIRVTLNLDKDTKQFAREARYVKRATLRERLLMVALVPMEQRFQDLSYKLLQFHTDVRPAYFGTMTSSPTSRGLLTGRCPISRTTELNYEYDSEADWIEDDDDDAGEELGDDDDTSTASKETDDGDSDDFLDDEDNPQPNEDRRVCGYLVPSIAGMYTAADCAAVEHMRLHRFIDDDAPIDPFRNYWEVSTTKDEAPKDSTTPNSTLMMMKKVSINTTTNSTPFPDTLLPEFKKAIQGCNLTKLNLVEKLRVDFRPYKVSKKAIEDKLSQVAQRQGKGQHDVWTLK